MTRISLVCGSTPWRAMTWSTYRAQSGAGDYRQQLRSGSGQNVTLTINGQTYVAAVLADGSGASAFRRQMSAPGLRDRSQYGERQHHRRKPGERYASGDCDLTAVAVSINAITADDVINAPKKARR